jgi:hypothetical protein
MTRLASGRNSACTSAVRREQRSHTNVPHPIPAHMPGSILKTIAALSLVALLTPAADAQSAERWTLTWTDDSYRYVDGQRVPTGEQSAALTVTPTRGDSVVATLPTANPAIVDTLDGTMTPQRIVLQSRMRGADIQAPSGAPAGGFSFTMRLELTLDGDRGTGSRQRRMTGPPGITVLPNEPTPITARRVP